VGTFHSNYAQTIHTKRLSPELAPVTNMSLSETEEENPFFIVGMVGALRFKGKSYEEIATQLKFDSVEEMRNRLESLQLPGWFVGAETSSDNKRVRE
jgi:hypothetical protein